MTFRPWMLRLGALMALAAIVSEPVLGVAPLPAVLATVVVAFATRRAIVVLARGNPWPPRVTTRHYL